MTKPRIGMDAMNMTDPSAVFGLSVGGGSHSVVSEASHEQVASSSAETAPWADAEKQRDIIRRIQTVAMAGKEGREFIVRTPFSVIAIFYHVAMSPRLANRKEYVNSFCCFR